ncbi:hypothetical protein PT015_03205 [Candidatus Mycobacterium wuenschmannii]|uniref:Secreted protein n=1 Tax=Candidatus Mycobacterium wuenschmannii TaxID=3027808 RepID=A0ABY8W060_9MYCO|nr:hypothetical protein [Candidatus Mycobacterium wuenschmannii]WIM88521.1 hypothetical protein PT015_03205 [Candidatus Mycobacterium wuenschmannii]
MNGTLHMPRSRGAVSGLLLLALGAWGALIPFIGPYFHFAYTPGEPWVWSTARAWLEVFPGVVTVAGGFLLLISGNRVTAMFGGWLAVIAGAWFVVGRTLSSTLRLGDVGHPIAATDAKRAAIEIASFSGLGALIVFVGGAVLARVTIRTARDVELAQQMAETPVESDTFNAFSESARTEVLTPAPRRHRREESNGLFRRSSAGAASH